ncbi:MAG TPA: hypothetical protein VIU46_10770 [Gallionellaceae bacterium]
MAQDKSAENSWVWVGRYAAVIVLSLILAAALGHMDLFEKTMLGSKLSASHIVQFLGFGAALVTLWVLGQRATIALQKQGGKWAAFQYLIMPVVSLVVVALAYSVVLLLLKPFMGPTLSSIFNWTFIAAILACAGWLVVAVLNQSDPLAELLTGIKNKSK